uniref:AN1-type domain-containing protein n=1 Tax=Pyramimonas orientalis virus TaxID=455367 RepID=A0A7M3UNU5_POV01|nr:hypothetical protein HWQ62_00245 [Pyramimonas orientalis virus]
MSVTVMTKSKCGKCNKKPGILSTCKYCSTNFCFNCLQQEVHSCKNIEGMKCDKLIILKRKLEEEKCVKTKVQRI